MCVYTCVEVHGRASVFVCVFVCVCVGGGCTYKIYIVGVGE